LNVHLYVKRALSILEIEIRKRCESNDILGFE